MLRRNRGSAVRIRVGRRECQTRRRGEAKNRPCEAHEVHLQEELKGKGCTVRNRGKS